jgi:autotransporter-associated beta strand protein
LSRACAGTTALVSLAAMAAVGGLTRSARATGTDAADNVNTSATTDLGNGANYAGGSPTSGNDTTFTASSYTNITFSLASGSMTTGTLDDLDATQALTINDANNSITLSTLQNNTANSQPADLIYVATGGNLSIGAAVILGASGNFDVAGTGHLQISGNISGAFALNTSGTGNVTLTGNDSYTGATTLSTGTLNIATGGEIGNVAGGASSAGAVTVGVHGNTTLVSALNINGGTLIASGITEQSVGNITLSNNGTINLGTGTFATFADNDGSGSLVTLGSGNVTAGSLTVERNGASLGTTIQTAGITTTGVQVSGATVSLSSNLWVGSNSSANFDETSGSITVSGEVEVATYSTTPSRYSLITVAGGNLTDTASTTGILIGGTGSGVNAQEAGEFLITGGTVTTNYLTFGDANTTTPQTTGSDVLEATGGTLYVGPGNISISSGTSSSVYAINLNGTIIGASGNWSSTLNMGLGATTNFRAGNSSGAAYNISLSGALSGAGGINVSGNGTLSLSGTDTYSGLTTLSSGTLNITGEGALGGANYSGLKFAGGTLQYATSLTTTGDITGNSTGVAKSVTLSANGTIDTNGDTITYANTFGNSGAGNLTIMDSQGTGSLTLLNNATYTGSTIIANGGTLQLGNNTAAGDGTFNSTSSIVDNGTLIFDRHGSLTTSAPISGGGVVTIAGSGTQTLSGSNGYSGATSVNGGTLNITGFIGNSSITVNSGGALSGFGTTASTGVVATAVTVNGNGAVSATNGSGSLTLNGLTLSASAGYSSGNYSTLNFFVSGGNVEAINIGTFGNPNGTFTLNSSGAYVDVTGLVNIGTTYTLMNFGSQGGAGSFSLSPSTGGTMSAQFGRDTYTLNETSIALTLSVTGVANPGVAYFDGAVSSTWSDTSNASFVNWSTDSAGQHDALQVPGSNTDVYLNASGSPSGSPAPAASSPTGTVTMSLGQTTVINSLNVTANGTDTISNTGGYTLQINAVADSQISAGNAISIGSGANAFTIQAPVIMGGSGANQLWTNASTNTFTVSGNITGTAAASSTQTLTLANTNTGATTISGAISDTSSGALTAIVVNDTNSGITTLSGANTYSGGTTVSAGTLTGSGATPLGATTGTLAVNGAGTVLNLTTTAATTTGSLRGTGASTINNGGTGELFTVNQTSAGTFSGSIAGAGGFTLGSGTTSTLTLAGNNTYTGATSVAAGNLSLGSTGALSGTSGVTTSGSGVFFEANGGVISGGTGFTQSSSGNSSLGGNNTYTGATSVTSGNLTLASTGTLGSTSAVTTSGSGNFSEASGGVIGGAANFTQGSTGNATLAGNNTYTGTTLLSAGTLTISSGGVIGGNTPAGAVTTGVSGGAIAPVTLNITGGTLNAASITQNGNSTINVSGNGNITLSNTFAVFADNSSSGTAGVFSLGNGTVNVGSLTIGRLSNAGQAPITAIETLGQTGGGVYVNGATAVLTISGALSLNNGTGTASSTNFRLDNGNVTVGGVTTVGIDSNARYGVLDVNGGTFTDNAAATTAGVLIGGTFATSQGEFLVSGGVATTNVITFGSSTQSSGTDVLEDIGGTLYVGTGGITAAETASTNSFYLGNSTVGTAPILGATGNWSSSMNITLANSDAPTAPTIQTGNATGAGYNIALSGVLSGSGGLIVTGNGSLTLSTANGYSGGTTINSGTVYANASSNSLGTSGVIVNSGGMLAGSGSSGSASVTINSGGTIGAGAAASTTGNLTTGAQVWSTNGAYAVKMLGSAGTGGVTVGTGSSGKLGFTSGVATPGSGQEGSDWDNLIMNGLTVSSSTGSPFTIVLSGTPSSAQQNMQYSWVIAETGSTNLPGNIQGSDNLLPGGGGADAGLFTLNTSNFTFAGVNNPYGSSPSSFSLEFEALSGGDYDLVLDYNSYNAAPEPGTAMLVIAGGLPMLMARRRRKNVLPSK